MKSHGHEPTREGDVAEEKAGQISHTRSGSNCRRSTREWRGRAKQKGGISIPRVQEVDFFVLEMARER